MSVSVCDHGRGRQRKYFDLHFPCLVCILFPSGNKLLMRQAGHSQKRMLTMRLHMKRHMLFALFCIECTHTHTHTRARTRTQLDEETHVYHICRDTPKLSLLASLSSFTTPRESRVNQLHFDWSDLVLTACFDAYAPAVRCSNGLHFMQQPCRTQLSMSTPFSLSFMVFVFTRPPPPLLLCSCADPTADALNGTCAE